jgi:CRISPR/Cas system-associated exonuclease Cas4 (RecB family)
VFPSAVTAQFRLRQAALESGGPVAADRFLAWDDFKVRTLSRRQPGKRPAGMADRMVFAGSLFRENAAAQEGPFLRDIVSPAWAGGWEAFVPALVRLLPSLHSVVGRLNGFRGAAGDDPYMEDLRLVGKRYETWLEERRLYEAAWNRGSFDGGDRQWVLFFPELAADWDEYREELEHVAGPSLVIVPLEKILPPPDRESPAARAAAGVLKACERKYIRFRNSADEYRWVSLMVKKLSDAGLTPEDMAISFPGIENAGPLIRELEKRDMEAILHEGKPLPDHGGGRIFAGIAACPASRWSFRALKNLLLDRAYPWKHREAIDALIEFGVRFRCISGLAEKGYDMWERSFRRLGSWNLPFAVPIPEIEKYYGRLKRDIQDLVQAKSFAALRKQWHIFEGRHFDRSRINDRTDSVIARALIALDELAEAAGGAEQENAYGIFQAYLGEKKYVHQPQRRGIPLYEYKVAAGIEPVVHFVLNMNQHDIAVQNRSFLREDRRDLLGIREQDMSAAFIGAYGFSALFPVFTVSGRTAGGPVVPHRMLLETAEEMDAKLLDPPEDPWAVEEALAGGAEAGTLGAAPAAMQRKGWEGVAILRGFPRGGDLRFSPLVDPALRAVLDRRLTTAGKPAERQSGPEEKDDGKEWGRRLSPTDLNEYLNCPFRWMLVRGLEVQERQTMIETIDQRELGMLYHKILERFFNRIAGNEKVYRQSRLGEYVEAIATETDRALEEARSREGAFQESVYGMLRKRINAALCVWLEKDSPVLDGCEVLGSEYPLRKEYAEEGLALSGKADLVLKRNTGVEAGGTGTDTGGRYILTDFKTAVIPEKKDLLCDPDTREPPRNVQMAAYIAMLEAGRAADGTFVTAGNQVGTARFYSLDLRKYRKVLDEKAEAGGGLPVSRDAYQPEVDAVGKILRRAAVSLESGVYTVPPRKDRHCQKCPVSSVCRANYIGAEQ